MFSKGDMIMYPMYGAGIIEKIEEREILGEKREYYILKIASEDLDVMIPVGKCDAIGIRAVVSEEDMDKAISILAEKETEMSANWNKRYRDNVDSLKTGDVFKVAQVTRNLIRSDRVKALSTGERKLLINAKKVLISEIVLVKGLSSSQADELIEGAV